MSSAEKFERVTYIRQMVKVNVDFQLASARATNGSHLHSIKYHRIWKLIPVLIWQGVLSNNTTYTLVLLKRAAHTDIHLIRTRIYVSLSNLYSGIPGTLYE